MTSTYGVIAENIYTVAAGWCPKCDRRVTASGGDAAEAVAALPRTCGAISCEAYVDMPYMELTERGWVDTRPR